MENKVNRGVIEIAREVLQSEPFASTLPALFDETNTQGMLRDNGTFARLHDQLLLPDNYTIYAVQAQSFGRAWLIAVDSPDIPPLDLTDPFCDYPLVLPSYSVETIHSMRTVRLTHIIFSRRRT